MINIIIPVFYPKKKKKNPDLSRLWRESWGMEQLREYYLLRPTLFVLFEKKIFLRKHYLLSCLPFKNI